MKGYDYDEEDSVDFVTVEVDFLPRTVKVADLKENFDVTQIGGLREGHRSASTNIKKHIVY